MKKCNAVISMVTTLTLLAHLGTMSCSLLTGWYQYGVCKGFAITTAILVSVHVLLCLVIFFFMHDSTRISLYKKKNLRTVLQRASAIGIVLLLHRHLKDYGFIMSGELLSAGQKTRILCVEILFFGMLFTHLSVSLSKALISLGIIRSDSCEKNLNRIMAVLCAMLFLLTTSALTAFIVPWG